MRRPQWWPGVAQNARPRIVANAYWRVATQNELSDGALPSFSSKVDACAARPHHVRNVRPETLAREWSPSPRACRVAIQNELLDGVRKLTNVARLQEASDGVRNVRPETLAREWSPTPRAWRVAIQDGAPPHVVGNSRMCHAFRRRPRCEARNAFPRILPDGYLQNHRTRDERKVQLRRCCQKRIGNITCVFPTAHAPLSRK